MDLTTTIVYDYSLRRYFQPNSERNGSECAYERSNREMLCDDLERKLARKTNHFR